MSDEIDTANDFAEFILDKQIRYLRSKAELQAGHEGDCSICGLFSQRLINIGQEEVCAPCRDRYKLK